MYDFAAEFLNAMNGSMECGEIIATIDGRKVTYTARVFNELKSDPCVTEIIDAQTGEVLFYR